MQSASTMFLLQLQFLFMSNQTLELSPHDNNNTHHTPSRLSRCSQSYHSSYQIAAAESCSISSPSPATQQNTTFITSPTTIIASTCSVHRRLRHSPRIYIHILLTLLNLSSSVFCPVVHNNAATAIVDGEYCRNSGSVLSLS